MKKMFVILAVIFAATGAQASVSVGQCGDKCNAAKAWVCHKQGNSTNPYELIHIDTSGLNGHQNHDADACATLIGDCNTEASGINKYRDIVFTCPSVPGGTPTQFNLDCSGGACQTKLTNHATFDFNVASGGINSDLYVCKVGFRVNDCPSCNKSEDKIVVKLKNGALVPILYGTPGPGFALFGLDNPAVLADVYLNSLDFSAGWYVQYCLKTTRLVVGDSVASSLAAKITANLEVNATADNGYLDEADVKFGVTHSCGNLAETPLSFLQDNDLFAPVDFVQDYITPKTSAFINSENTICLNGTGCRQQACVWTVHFQETSCKIRSIKNVDCTKDPIACTPWNSSLHTILDVDTELTCPVGGCV